MITPKEYLMGRELDNPIDKIQSFNMADLLSRVNYVLGKLTLITKISSGYRPPKVNASIGGAKKSLHMSCSAVDLLDKDGSLAKLLMNNLKLLEEAGLWLESPEHTKGWVHLDTKPRKNRVFIP